MIKMGKLNCPNCGAVIDPELNKCAYCGTSYFDLTSIDFTHMQPIYLKLKTPMGIITQKCIPYLGDITLEHETTDCIDYRGNVIRKFYTGTSMTTNISFEAIRDGNTMFTLRSDE